MTCRRRLNPTCLRLSFKPLQRITTYPENLRLVGACTSVESPQRTGPAPKFTVAGQTKTYCRLPSECALQKWSWRRDLNPRPSDYKSDALPAELRQPIPPSKRLKTTRPEVRNTRAHSRSAHTTAQTPRLAHRRRASKRDKSHLQTTFSTFWLDFANGAREPCSHNRFPPKGRHYEEP